MATKAAVSEEEYLGTSFPDLDREYRDGEILERTLADFDHAQTQGELYSFFRPLRGSHRFFPATEMRLCLRPGRHVVADLAVFWPDRPTAKPPEMPPFIVVEILSPDDRMSEVRDKLREYVEAGVRHVWLADPYAGRSTCFVPTVCPRFLRIPSPKPVSKLRRPISSISSRTTEPEPSNQVTVKPKRLIPSKVAAL